MADGRFYWLRLKRDFFKRHDIRIIEAMPNGKDYILFYLKLLCESVDHEGNLRFSEHIPYSAEMLATITDTNVDIVRSAIKVFCELNMMEVLDDGTFFMTEVNRMIGSETQWAEKKRAYRERIAQDTKGQIEDNVLTMSGQKTDMSDKSKSIEIETEKEIEIDITRAPAREASPSDAQVCMDLWNGLQVYGIKPVIDVTGNRYQALMDVIQQYGMGKYRAAIELISKSQFLQGQNTKHWVISFDWFLKNFARVLEGTYNDTDKPKKSSVMSEGSEDEWEAALKAIGR